jgi:hypothetical protein
VLQLTYVGALISVVDAQGAGEVAQLDGEGVEGREFSSTCSNLFKIPV